MRFWHKVLLIVLILFIVTLDVSIFTIIYRNWILNMNREVERASSEQVLIANNIYENLSSISSRGAMFNDSVYYDVARSYGDYYSKQGIALQMWDKNRIVFPLDSGANTVVPTKAITQAEQNGVRYIQISKNLPSPYSDILLVYQRNINSLYEVQQSLNQFFIIINLIMGVCLITLLYFAVKHLTRPLLMLSETTKQIADGNYEKRITLKSKDEFGELADNFNKMAAAVDGHITKLLLMADEKQRLVDNLAHELRTPLTSMQGFADYIMTANSSEEDKLIAVNYIKSETQRLSQLTNKLLEISVTKQELFLLKPVNVKDLFSTAAKIENQQLRLHNQTLVTNISVDYVSGDFDLLVSFLNNCIENAIHASKEGSEIVMSAYEKDNSVILEVCDNGCGMSQEQTEKAFEAFYRADKSRSRQHGGVGLGLALCKQISAALGAKVNIYSEIKKGTKIQIILQLYNNITVTS